MNAWAFIRIILVGAIGYWTYFWATHLVPAVTLPWWAVVLYLVVPPLLFPLIVAISVAGGRLELRRPSWRRNPFVGADPLQNAYLAAYCCFACGSFWIYNAFVSSERPSFTRAPLPVALFFAGVGCWVSVRICVTLFRSRLKT